MESTDQRVARVLKENIVIAPYDARWPEMFRQEVAHLRAVLPAELVGRIEHYGSTAVPGLAAKPVVDVLIEVTDLDATRTRIAPILASEGYEYFWRPTFGDDVPPWYAWFIKRDRPGGERTHHLHMITTAPEFAEHWRALDFRDYLCRHVEVAREYEALKYRLAAEHTHERIAYTRAKSEFIAKVMARLGRSLKEGGGEPLESRR
ncbi:MAG: GrpB family protein [Acidobacteria bacterium]|nr:GrpB family protein [Acidobacteriota bacterium]MBV9481773.1 GrpB family protein [Acidobacteriota bacterium]